MHLVVGASGMVGMEVCRHLTHKHLPVRALVRASTNEQKLQQLTESGAETAIGDIREANSLEVALQGVETVITTISSMPFSYVAGENDIQSVDLNGMLNLIDKAREAGVKHFIYTSFSGQLDLGFPLRNAKREVEQALKVSGLTYTILRPSYFMEVWLSPAAGFDVANDQVQVYGDGTQPVSYISFRDVAQLISACVNNQNAHDRVLELGGPDKISQLDVVRIFEEACGYSLQLKFSDEETLQSQYEASLDPMQKSFSALMLCLAQGDPIDMDEVLKIFPIEMTSVRTYANSLFGPD